MQRVSSACDLLCRCLGRCVCVPALWCCLLGTVFTESANGLKRPLAWLKNVIGHPITALRILWPFGWARRTVILLVMQTLDNSIRVPCVISWPGVIPEKSVINKTVTFTDFFPTLLEMAGFERPDNLVLRGESILPLLKNKSQEWNNELYAEYINLRTFRTPEWKIVLDFSEKELHEFYDLKSDPGEHNNLYFFDDPKVKLNKEKLKNQLLNIMNKIDDPLLNSTNRNNL